MEIPDWVGEVILYVLIVAVICVVGYRVAGWIKALRDGYRDG